MKLLAGTALSLLLGLVFLSVFPTSGMTGLAHHSTNCPFMTHEEVICPMNLTDLISTWRSIFAAFLPPLLILAISIGIAVIAPYLFLRRRDVSTRLLYHWQWWRRRSDKYFVRPWQDLFSNGILNPKLH